MTDYVAYYRVSTARQGKSRNGLDAQKAAVAEIIRNNGNTLLDEFEEVESGKRADRPALTKALRRCKATGATLIVAKLDRLSRNAAFLMTLRDSGVDFVAADMPEANTLTVGILAVVAQAEREAISLPGRSGLDLIADLLKTLRALRLLANSGSRDPLAMSQTASLIHTSRVSPWRGPPSLWPCPLVVQSPAGGRRSSQGS